MWPFLTGISRRGGTPRRGRQSSSSSRWSPTRAALASSRPRSASPHSTTTARSGREADAHPGRLPATTRGRDGQGRPLPGEPTTLEGRRREGLRLALRRDHQHYNGDDSDLQLMAAGLVAASRARPSKFADIATEFLHSTEHPTLHRPYVACGFRPMIELLEFLAANGFTCFIASGGGRDFMRTVSSECYGIPPERADRQLGQPRIQRGRGRWRDRAHGQARLPGRWSREAHPYLEPRRRRPILAGGNANGDIPMFSFTGGPHRAALRLLIRHDDAEREFDYVTGPEGPRTRPGRWLDRRSVSKRLANGLRCMTASTSPGRIRSGGCSTITSTPRTISVTHNAASNSTRNGVRCGPRAAVPRPDTSSRRRQNVHAARVGSLRPPHPGHTIIVVGGGTRKPVLYRASPREDVARHRPPAPGRRRHLRYRRARRP